MKYTKLAINTLSIHAILFSLMVIPCAADILIDDFNDGAALVQVGVGTSNFTTFGGMLGGERDESVTVTDQGGDEFLGALGFSGFLQITQGADDEINGGLTYDNFSSFDLTDNGVLNSFELNFTGSDINSDLSGVISITAVSGANSSTQFITVPANSNLPQPGFLIFSDFAGVDFTQLDSISLNFDFASNAGRDLKIGSFSAVFIPEPSSLVLIGICMIGCLNRRRR